MHPSGPSLKLLALADAKGIDTSSLTASTDIARIRRRTLGKGATSGRLRSNPTVLVERFDHSEGYKLFSLILASFVVNCHSATA